MTKEQMFDEYFPSEDFEDPRIQETLDVVEAYIEKPRRNHRVKKVRPIKYAIAMDVCAFQINLLQQKQNANPNDQKVISTMSQWQRRYDRAKQIQGKAINYRREEPKIRRR